MTLGIAYIVMVIFFSIAAPFFFTVKNFLNIGLYSSIMGISAVGATMVLLLGNIDVSVGAVMGLVGVAVAILLKANVSLVVTILFALAMGVAAGFSNGLLVTKLRISSFIVTLATMAIFRGLAFVLCGGLSIVITDRAFGWFGRGYLWAIPVPLILMILFYAVFMYILRNRKFGRMIYSCGGNPRASYLSGIKVNSVIMGVMTLNGFAAGIAGIVMASQTGSGLPQAGTGYELDIIASAVLGGTSLSGGRGNLIGTFIGVLIISTLTTGMVLMNIPSFYQQIAKGFVLLLAVSADSLRRGKGEAAF